MGAQNETLILNATIPELGIPTKNPIPSVELTLNCASLESAIGEELVFNGQAIGNVAKNEVGHLVLKLNDGAPKLTLVGSPAYVGLIVENASSVDVDMDASAMAALTINADRINVLSPILTGETLALNAETSVISTQPLVADNIHCTAKQVSLLGSPIEAENIYIKGQATVRLEGKLRADKVLSVVAPRILQKKEAGIVGGQVELQATEKLLTHGMVHSATTLQIQSPLLKNQGKYSSDAALTVDARIYQGSVTSSVVVKQESHFNVNDFHTAGTVALGGCVDFQVENLQVASKGKFAVLPQQGSADVKPCVRTITVNGEAAVDQEALFSISASQFSAPTFSNAGHAYFTQGSTANIAEDTVLESGGKTTVVDSKFNSKKLVSEVNTAFALKNSQYQADETSVSGQLTATDKSHVLSKKQFFSTKDSIVHVDESKLEADNVNLAGVTKVSGEQGAIESDVLANQGHLTVIKKGRLVAERLMALGGELLSEEGELDAGSIELTGHAVLQQSQVNSDQIRVLTNATLMSTGDQVSTNSFEVQEGAGYQAKEGQLSVTDYVCLDGISRLQQQKVQADRLTSRGRNQWKEVDVNLQENWIDKSKILTTKSSKITAKGIATFLGERALIQQTTVEANCIEVAKDLQVLAASSMQGRFFCTSEDATVLVKNSQMQFDKSTHQGDLTAQQSQWNGQSFLQLQQGKVNVVDGEFNTSEQMVNRSDQAFTAVGAKLDFHNALFDGKLNAKSSMVRGETLLLAESELQDSTVTMKKDAFLTGETHQLDNTRVAAEQLYLQAKNINAVNGSELHGTTKTTVGKESVTFVENSRMTGGALDNLGVLALKGEKNEKGELPDLVDVQAVNQLGTLIVDTGKVTATEDIDVSIIATTRANDSAWQARKMALSGKIKAAETKFKAETNITLKPGTEAEVHGVQLNAKENLTVDRSVGVTGEQLSMQAEHLRNYGDIDVNRVAIKANKVTNIEGRIDGGESLAIKANHWVFNGFAGQLTSSNTDITTSAYLSLLGDTNGSNNLSIKSLVSLNGGLMRGYNVNSQSLFSLNAGLILPSLPTSWDAVFSAQHWVGFGKNMLCQFLPNSASLINLGFMAVPKIASGAYSLYQRSNGNIRNMPGLLYQDAADFSALFSVESLSSSVDKFCSMEMTDIISSVLTAKSYAVSGMQLYSAGQSACGLDTGKMFEDFSGENLANSGSNFLDQSPFVAASAFMPTATQESLVSVNTGGIYSGTVTQNGLYGVNTGYASALGSYVNTTNHLNNSGVLGAGAASTTLSGSTLTNSGLVTGRDQVQLNYHQSIHNQEGADIDSRGKTTIKTGEMKNDGDMHLANGTVKADRFQQSETGQSTLDNVKGSLGLADIAGEQTLQGETALNIDDLTLRAGAALSAQDTTRVQTKNASIAGQATFSDQAAYIGTEATTVDETGGMKFTDEAKGGVKILNVEGQLSGQGQDSQLVADELNVQKTGHAEFSQGHEAIVKTANVAGKVDVAGEKTTAFFDKTNVQGGQVNIQDKAALVGKQVNVESGQLALENKAVAQLEEDLTIGKAGSMSATEGSYAKAKNISVKGAGDVSDSTLHATEKLTLEKGSDVTTNKALLQGDQKVTLAGDLDATATHAQSSGDVVAEKTAHLKTQEYFVMAGEKVTHAADHEYTGIVKMDAEKEVRQTKQSNMHVDREAGTENLLVVKGETGVLNGKTDADHGVVDVKHMDKANDFVAGTGKYKNQQFTDSLDVTVDEKITMKNVQRTCDLGVTARAIDFASAYKNEGHTLSLTTTHGDVTTGHDVKAENIFVDSARDMNIKNGATVEATKYAQVKAKRDVKVVCKEETYQGKHDQRKKYTASALKGGTGTKETKGVGLAVYADGKIVNDGSKVGAEGKAYLEAKKGVEGIARHHTYTADKHTEKTWYGKKTHHETQATDMQKALFYSSGDQVVIRALEKGGVNCTGTDFLTKLGTDIYSRETVNLFDFKVNHKSKDKTQYLWGAVKNSHKESHDEVIPVYVVDNGKTRIHSEKNVNGRGVLFMGTGDLHIKGKNVHLWTSTADHAIRDKSRATTFTGALPDAIKAAYDNDFEALVGQLFPEAGAAMDAVSAVVDANGATDKAKAAVQAAQQMQQTAQAVKNSSVGQNVLDNAGVKSPVGVNVQQTHSKQQYQTAGPGGIERNHVVIEADNDATVEGMNVDVESLKMKAKTATFAGKTLEASSTTKTAGVSAQVTPTGEVISVTANASKTKTSSTTHQQANIKMRGNFDIQAEEMNIHNATVDADTVTGHVDKLNVQQDQDVSRSKTQSASASSNGFFSASQSKEKHQTTAAQSVLNARDMSGLTCKEAHLKNSHVTAENDSFKPTTLTTETQQDRHDSKTTGFSGYLPQTVQALQGEQPTGAAAGSKFSLAYGDRSVGVSLDTMAAVSQGAQTLFSSTAKSVDAPAATDSFFDDYAPENVNTNASAVAPTTLDTPVADVVDAAQNHPPSIMAGEAEKKLMDWALTGLSTAADVGADHVGYMPTTGILKGLGAGMNFGNRLIQRQLADDPHAVGNAALDAGGDLVYGLLVPWQLTLAEKALGEVARPMTDAVENGQVEMYRKEVHALVEKDPSLLPFLHDVMDRDVLWECYGMGKAAQVIGNGGEHIADGVRAVISP